MDEYAKEKAETETPQTESDFISDMLERFMNAAEYDSEQRRRAIDDMRFAFVKDNQWDTHLAAKRRNRPCYEFNRIRQLIRRVTGQQLQNKPQIKVRAVEDGDVDTAEILNGLIRNIETTSHAETAYDTAFQWACGGGFGAFRVITEYESDNSFNQCLKIKAIPDPFTVFFDPAAREFDRSDARFCFVTELIPKSEFKRRWPKAEMVDFEAPNGSGVVDRDWWYRDTVRIAEYWYKELKKKTIYQLSDGTVVDAEEFDPIADEAANPPLGPDGQPQFPPLTIAAEREVEVPVVHCCLVSGRQKLEKSSTWPGTIIPIVPQWGDLISIDGKQIYSGMTRFGRDAQSIHNFELSTAVEVLAKLPNMPLMATAKQIAGYESYYNRLGYDDPPVLLYNADPAAGGAPERQQMAQFPAALAQMSAVATDELKANLGIYDASIGARSNETSGRAILARQQEGDVANFVYIDNQVKALKRLGEILVDAIPKVYDAQRSIRILGDNMTEKYVEINRPMIDRQTGQIVTINDLSRGKYDVTVTVGKSFDTARMETAEAAQAMVGSPGPFGMMAQYLLLQNLDVPGIDEYKKAARKILVAQGLLEPEEGDQPPAPPPPDPEVMASAEYKAAQAKKAMADTRKTMVETDLMLKEFPVKQAQNVANISQTVQGTNRTAFDIGYQGG